MLQICRIAWQVEGFRRVNGALWARNPSVGRISTSVERVSLFLNAFNFHKATYSVKASLLESKSAGLHVNPC